MIVSQSNSNLSFLYSTFKHASRAAASGEGSGFDKMPGVLCPIIELSRIAFLRILASLSSLNAMRSDISSTDDPQTHPRLRDSAPRCSSSIVLGWALLPQEILWLRMSAARTASGAGARRLHATAFCEPPIAHEEWQPNGELA
jgi:hypothetical protein